MVRPEIKKSLNNSPSLLIQHSLWRSCKAPEDRIITEKQANNLITNNYTYHGFQFKKP